MNLVQIQERLKDAPTQAVMQYANGGNPMVPPYMALAELQRRESINKASANQQALAQGKQPSVKEQVEQAAGLAALQKQMQAKGLQSLMGASVPTPSIPEPQRQPESEGVAGLPTDEMYNFAEGGIIGYAGGGGAAASDGLISIEELKRQYARAARSGKPEDTQEALRLLKAIKAREGAISKTVNVPVAEIDMTPASVSKQTSQPQFGFQGDVSDISRQIASIPDEQERQRAAAQLQREIAAGNPALRTARREEPTGEMAMSAQAEAPRTGIAALPGAEKATGIITGLMEQPKPQESIATEREFAKAYGIDKPYGEERMKRLEQMQAERQQMLGSRDMERAMRVLGGIAGQGLPGAGSAYLQAVEGERASDLAFRKQMDELMANTEEKRRADLVASSERARKEFGTSRELQVGAAEKLFTAEQQRQLKQAELDMRKLELKAQSERKLTPDEQYLMRVSQGDPEKYLKGVEDLAKAKAGARTEMASERSLTALFNKYNENPMLKSEYKTFQDYLKAYRSATGETETSDPILSKADSILSRVK
ncbi:MAG: hypothetical protein RL563_2701 [Pseudomonadota bacterium]|jgi:hypothetical protein